MSLLLDALSECPALRLDDLFLTPRVIVGVASTVITVGLPTPWFASRLCKDHGPENLAWLRRVAVSLLRSEPTRASIKCKRRMAGWNNDCLLRILLSNSGDS